MELNVHVGGRPGIDCGGFCEFCFYRTVDFSKLDSLSLGCAYCPPHQIGCDYCQKTVTRVENNFKPINQVLNDVGKNLMMLEFLGKLNYKDLRITISGGADAFYYSHLNEVVRILKDSGITIHLGYVSGKGIKDERQAYDLVSLGVDELSFSIFSTDTHMRKKWMHDENPQIPIDSLKQFCQNCDVNASVVVIPGVNEENEIFKTCEDLEEWGVKSFVLRRFANNKNQGLILNDERPLMEGITPHSYEEFQELVCKVSDEFPFVVYGLPYYDPKKDIPFAILKRKNRRYLEQLPFIKSEATIITGKLALPFLERIFNLVDESRLVNVVASPQEIGDLITHQDLEHLDFTQLKRNIIIPGGALVHDEEVKKILSKDGTIRNVIRGPYVLTNHSVDSDQVELIENEYKSLKELIDKINLFN